MTDVTTTLAQVRAALVQHKKGEFAHPVLSRTNGEVISWLSTLAEAVETLKAERDYLYDLPLCRLQLPDGTVPGNTEEALDHWHRTAQEASRDRDRLQREADTTAVILNACRLERDDAKKTATDLDRLNQAWSEKYATEHTRAERLRREAEAREQDIASIVLVMQEALGPSWPPNGQPGERVHAWMQRLKRSLESGDAPDAKETTHE